MTRLPSVEVAARQAKKNKKQMNFPKYKKKQNKTERLTGSVQLDGTAGHRSQQRVERVVGERLEVVAGQVDERLGEVTLRDSSGYALRIHLGMYCGRCCRTGERGRREGRFRQSVAVEAEVFEFGRPVERLRGQIADAVVAQAQLLQLAEAADAGRNAVETRAFKVDRLHRRRVRGQRVEDGDDDVLVGHVADDDVLQHRGGLRRVQADEVVDLDIIGVIEADAAVTECSTLVADLLQVDGAQGVELRRIVERQQTHARQRQLGQRVETGQELEVESEQVDDAAVHAETGRVQRRRAEGVVVDRSQRLAGAAQLDVLRPRRRAQQVRRHCGEPVLHHSEGGVVSAARRHEGRRHGRRRRHAVARHAAARRRALVAVARRVGLRIVVAQRPAPDLHLSVHRPHLRPARAPAPRQQQLQRTTSSTTPSSAWISNRMRRFLPATRRLSSLDSLPRSTAIVAAPGRPGP